MTRGSGYSLFLNSQGAILSMAFPEVGQAGAITAGCGPARDSGDRSRVLADEARRSEPERQFNGRRPSVRQE